MRHKLIEEKPKTYAIIFETGEELASGLKEAASELKISTASFKAIGAFSFVKLACEVVLTESSEKLQKQIDPESGIALIRP